MTAPPGLGIKIKRARERRRWSQRQLAEVLGVDRKSVDNWEHGRTYPRNSIGALEQVLGISLTDAPEPETEWERWERETLSNPDIPPEVARAIVADARRAVRDGGPPEGGGSSAAPSPAARPGRHRAAG